MVELPLASQVRFELPLAPQARSVLLKYACAPGLPFALRKRSELAKQAASSARAAFNAAKTVRSAAAAVNR